MPEKEAFKEPLGPAEKLRESEERAEPLGNSDAVLEALGHVEAEGLREGEAVVEEDPDAPRLAVLFATDIVGVDWPLGEVVEREVPLPGCDAVGDALGQPEAEGERVAPRAPPERVALEVDVGALAVPDVDGLGESERVREVHPDAEEQPVLVKDGVAFATLPEGVAEKRGVRVALPKEPVPEKLPLTVLELLPLPRPVLLTLAVVLAVVHSVSVVEEEALGAAEAELVREGSVALGGADQVP